MGDAKPVSIKPVSKMGQTAPQVKSSIIEGPVGKTVNVPYNMGEKTHKGNES